MHNLSSLFSELTIFLTFFLICTYRSTGEAAQNRTTLAVFAFGDSIIDTGNNNHIATIINVNFPPYGRDFMGGKPTGRFSNGKVPPDLIAEELGIKDTLPPYLDPNLNETDLLTGVNFASGGAGFDPLTSDLVSVLSLQDQLRMFKEYMIKLRKLVGHERRSAIISQSLVVIVAGSNDFVNTYYTTRLRAPEYRNVSSYADFLVSRASSFVKDLYKLGVQRVVMFGLPPLGCLPFERTLRGGLERRCVDSYNQDAEMFNSKLSAELRSINHPSARVIYVDIYRLSLDIIHFPVKYGFRISDFGCCGTGTLEVAFLCQFACPVDRDYVFWDSFHLTERAYRIIMRQIFEVSIKSFVHDDSPQHDPDFGAEVLLWT